MSLTILEVLQNADYNLQNTKLDIQIDMAKEQLHNALKEIEKGKSLDDVFEGE